MCVYVHSTYACNAAGLIKNHAQPGDLGLCMPQMALANPGPVLSKNMSLVILMHTPCLGISMIRTGMTLPNAWPRLKPHNTMSYEVCRRFSVKSDSFNASSSPLIQSPPPPSSKPGRTAGALCSTRKIPTPSLPSVTRSAARPPAGRRQVGTLLANLPAQYRRGRVPSNRAGGSKKEQQLF